MKQVTIYLKKEEEQAPLSSDKSRINYLGWGVDVVTQVNGTPKRYFIPYTSILYIEEEIS